MEILRVQATPAAPAATLEPLIEKFGNLSIFDSTRTREISRKQDPHSKIATLSDSGPSQGVRTKDPSHFQLGLRNSASIYQESISKLMHSDQEITTLTGAQQGLVLSATAEGNIVRWPRDRPAFGTSDPSRLIGMMGQLPFQVGNVLPTDEGGSTEILSSTSTGESGTNSTISHTEKFS
jgi:hypothetical protein